MRQAKWMGGWGCSLGCGWWPSWPGRIRARSVEPFNGKDLSGWKLKRDTGSQWCVGGATMNPEKTGELLVADAPAGRAN